MPSFGEKLKQEREKRNITLEQISSATKIGTRMLQALEEDKFNQLPGGIFNKGFVRAYARVVGLDEDQTVADYLQASGDAPPISTEIAAREDSVRENAERVSRLEASADTPARQLPWGLFAAVLLVIALALSLWSRRQREHARQSLHPAPTNTGQQSPAQPLSSERSAEGSSGSAARAVEERGTSSSPIMAAPAAGSASSAVPQKPKVSAPAPGEFAVLIKAREESWISITADGRTITSELLPAGSERTVHGRKEVIVKAGNAGGVDFQFNGKKLDIGGEYGEVKTVTFGPQGILPNAPEPPTTL